MTMTMTMERPEVMNATTNTTVDVTADVKETNENVERMVLDAWSVTEKEDGAFYELLHELSKQSDWQHGITSSEMKVVPLEDMPLLAEELAKKYHTKPELIMDTMENTKLLLDVNGTYYPLRTSAMKSMLETAKISGHALSKVSTENLAQILNYCLEVAPGKTLLLVRAGKASAVLSADARGYGILPMDELYTTTKETIKEKFGSGTFMEGSVSHEYMKVFFKLPQSNKALKEYKDFVKSVYDTDAIVPGVILKSSDVGMAAATLEPVFICDNRYWKIGNADKLHHKPCNNIESFKEMSAMMFSKLDKTIEKFTELSKITINHPYNAFMLACKKAKLPKRFACEALDDFSMMVAEDDITNAHDIYIGITEILFYSKRDGMSSLDVSYLEDNVSKILNFNWKELDLPGEHSW